MIKKVSFVFVFSLLLFSLISAVPENFLKEDLSQLIGTSDKNVNYDKEILDNFNFTEEEKEYFAKGYSEKIPKKEIEWVYVMVDIKDTSNITIPNKNSPDFKSTLQERNEILIKQTNAVLSTLSSDEFQLKRNSEFGGFFSGNITKNGFNKLLGDERVEHVYAKKYGHISLDESASLINADDVWTDYDGSGQTVCIIDTGVAHNSLILPEPTAEYCYCYELIGGCCPDETNEDYSARDNLADHGTFIIGILASD